jgi:hypothetical protein
MPNTSPTSGVPPRIQFGNGSAHYQKSVWAIYREWKERGADFVTEPKDHGMEIRCYTRDPDGHLIEVGQSAGILDKDKAPRN